MNNTTNGATRAHKPCPRPDCDATALHGHDSRRQVLPCPSLGNERAVCPIPGPWVNVLGIDEGCYLPRDAKAEHGAPIWGAPKPNKKKPAKTYRNADGGRFVDAAYAAANPGSTVAEDNTRVRELAAQLAKVRGYCETVARTSPAGSAGLAVARGVLNLLDDKEARHA